MCTLSWSPGPDGYQVFFNRDEQRTRPRAAPPEERLSDGVRYLAPEDRPGGGTWIAVNEAGITICLLNRYDDGARAPDPDRESRGGIVTRVAGATSMDQLIEGLARLPWDRYAPCTVFAFDGGAQVRSWRWAVSGRLDTATRVTAGFLASSSAVDGAAVVDGRRRQFGTVHDPATLVRLHASHHPERGARSVCMHRPDAHTVAFCRVSVTGTGVQLTYVDGAPCSGVAPQVYRLGRSGPR